jgi:two-component system chemotaxis response regulator CheB
MPNPENEAFIERLFVVAFAASAGGLNALSIVLSTLPSDFAAAIIIVQHLSPDHQSYMAEILNRRTALRVVVAQENDCIKAGVIYLAPPNWHLTIQSGGILKLNQEARLHFLRPSADLMFTSLAESFTDHAIAVVLTGTGVDGASGIKTIKAMGGTVIAQDETSSEFFGMPGKAIETGQVDYILPLNQIASVLEGLVTTGKSH